GATARSVSSSSSAPRRSPCTSLTCCASSAPPGAPRQWPSRGAAASSCSSPARVAAGTHGSRHVRWPGPWQSVAVRQTGEVDAPSDLVGDVPSPQRRPCALGAGAEQLAGTASYDVTHLLIEHSGRWGRKAFVESELPDHVRATV